MVEVVSLFQQSATSFRWTLTLDPTLTYGSKKLLVHKFVLDKSGRNFSATAIDQACEQANAVINADGGVITMSEDPSALRRWMVAGPKVSYLVEQYEAVS